MTPITSNRSYTLDGHQLEGVSSINDLGFTITSDLPWSRHIEVTVPKANNTLGLLKRICYDMRDRSTKKLLYCALMPPKLEYSSSVWSPYTFKHRALIENVQRTATKFIPNYPQNMTYNERLIKLNVLPLEHRREISDLLLFFKSRNGLISTEVSNYLRIFQPRHRSRNYDPNNYYIIYEHNRDYYRKYFFIRTAELWNSLPSCTKATNSLSVFKTSLISIYLSKLVSYSPSR